MSDRAEPGPGGALRAGLGSAAITPELPVALAGYGARTGPAREVFEALTARALFLDDGGAAMCLVSCDLLGMTRDFALPIRERIADRLELPLAAVITACDHIHAGPSTMTGSDAIGWKIQHGYAERLLAGCVEAAEAARGTAEPAALRFARSRLPRGLAGNRRGHPFRPELAVLELARAGGGGRIGLVANLGIHPTVTGPETMAVSTDWVGPFRRALEADAGGTALFLQGCQGDVNPDKRGLAGADPLGDAARHGEAIAKVVLAALDEAEPVDGPLSVRGHRPLSLRPGATPLGMLAGPVKKRETELIEWQLGAVTLVTVPGEGFHALERALVARHGPRLLIAGLAPDWHGYLPLPFTRGYEERLSYGRRAVDRLIAELTGGTR